MLDDGEPKTRAFGMRAPGLPPIEAVEDPGQVRGCDAAAGIRHRQGAVPIADRDAPAIRIARGVAQQVRQHDVKGKTGCPHCGVRRHPKLDIDVPTGQRFAQDATTSSAASCTGADSSAPQGSIASEEQERLRQRRHAIGCAGDTLKALLDFPEMVGPGPSSSQLVAIVVSGVRNSWLTLDVNCFSRATTSATRSW